MSMETKHFNVLESFELEVWYFSTRVDRHVAFILVKAENIEQAVQEAKKIIKHPFRIYYKNYKVYPL